MGDDDRAILLNRDVIAINQDSLGIQGTKILDHNTTTITRCTSAVVCSTIVVKAQQSGGWEIWVRPLSGGDIAAVLYNKGEQPIDIALNLSDISAFNRSTIHRMNVKELFSGNTSTVEQTITAKQVPPH